MIELSDLEFMWKEAWANRWSEYRSDWVKHFNWLDETLWRVLHHKGVTWLHIYEDRTNGMTDRVRLGDAKWLAGSFDWQAHEVIMALRKRAKKTAAGTPAPWRGDSESAMRYPLITEFLCYDKDDDGDARKRGTMTLMSIDRGWRVVLNNKDTGESLWAAADSMAGLLDALELELMADEPNWRDARGNQGSEKKKR